MPSVVSLFSGCGGLDLGFAQTGFDIRYAVDNDPAAVECYSRNIDAAIRLRDVTSAEFMSDIAAVGSVDVVLGGFPCQGFSKAGPKRRDDPRNALYVRMRDALATLRPKVFIAENVDGLSQNFAGGYLKQIVSDFGELGYDVDWRILDAASFGLPQHRRRVIIVGRHRSLRSSFAWPIPTHRAASRNGDFRLPASEQDGPLFAALGGTASPLPSPPTIGDVLADLLDVPLGTGDHSVAGTWPQKYEHVFAAVGEGQKLCNVRHSPTSVYTWQIPQTFGATSVRERRILDAIAKNRRHTKYGKKPNGNPLTPAVIRTLTALQDIDADLESLVSKAYLKVVDDAYDLRGATFCSGLFKRPLWSEPSPTVLTNFHNPRYFLHPLQNRPFTVRECARLQSFPDSFQFLWPDAPYTAVDAYRLIGNAVAPILSRALAESVLQLLTEQDERIEALREVALR